MRLFNRSALFSFLFSVIFILLFPAEYIGIFDESIVNSLFVFEKQNLKIYEDFKYFYPPGMWFLAKVFNFSQLEQFVEPKIFIWTLTFFIQLQIFGVIKRVSPKSLNSILMIFAFSNLILFLLGSETFTIYLIFYLFTIFLFYQHSKKNLFLIFILLFLILLFRFDRYLIAILYLCIHIFILFKNKTIVLKDGFLQIIIGLVPIFLLLLLLQPFHELFYLKFNQIFIDPFVIQRDESDFKINLTFILGFISFLLISICLFKNFNKNKATIFNVFLHPFFFLWIFSLPYAFRLPDLQHVFPLFFFAIILFVFSNNVSIGFKVKSYLSFFVLIFILFLAYRVFLLKKIDSDCGSKVVDFIQNSNINYDYLYVGHEDYSNFNFNYVYFYNYFSNLLKPASQYLTEEPGLTNTCHVQGELIKDLRIKKTIYLLHDNISKGINSQPCKVLLNFFKDNLVRIDSCSLNNNAINIYYFDGN